MAGTSVQELETAPSGPKARRRRTWGDFPPPPPLRESERRACPSGKCGPVGRVAAAILLVLVSPILLAVALAIKLESPGGPVFYRQVRVGVERRRQNSRPVESDRRAEPGYGRPFRIWKFRTMIPDAEAATGPVWALARDPRITRVGGVLRHLRLDELPQLMNVLTGEMSLIGPRPERPHFVERLSREMPNYSGRLQVVPGITGLAQVEREYDASVQDVRTKLKYDLFYVEHKSTLMDLKILLRTVDVVLRGRGAH